ncbi:2'-5' RNA ligase family protein [Alkalicella caledoniensis]|uniref:2'-5' RNA ligase family protein n=1 Tax=Alkalicella caledoniensis TaxID=2731377 RepID=A0A7G9W6G0_ALKCA|nr:2'-5' RNA ligase family protein [Alkalicella caledoniensis]QNO14272.1 2'-5' RNA ligase family protein [Alkalicella caledoniensis]
MSDEVAKSVMCLIPDNEIEGLENFRQKYINGPGKSVPFHVTLLSNFYLPKEIDESIINTLTEIARSTGKFKFAAKPLSIFPTTNVIYLTPSPATHIEALTTRLHDAFPKFYKPEYGLPIFHMTIALGNPPEATDKITYEYKEQFGYKPLPLTAGHIAIYVQKGEEWHHYLSLDL